MKCVECPCGKSVVVEDDYKAHRKRSTFACQSEKTPPGEEEIQRFRADAKEAKLLLLCLREVIGQEDYTAEDYFYKPGERSHWDDLEEPFMQNNPITWEGEDAQQHYQVFTRLQKKWDWLDKYHPELVKEAERLCKEWAKMPMRDDPAPKKQDGEKRYTLGQLRSAYMAGFLTKENGGKR